jgi:hypothetical protein
MLAVKISQTSPLTQGQAQMDWNKASLLHQVNKVRWPNGKASDYDPSYKIYLEECQSGDSGFEPQADLAFFHFWVLSIPFSRLCVCV